MPKSSLPARASLEYLKKLAKERLQKLREADPRAKLTTAQLAIAREHGFSSWRALKAEVDRRRGGDTTRFFEACGKGDVAALRELLAEQPELVRATRPHPRFEGWTGLHSAAQGGHPAAVRLLLERGSDPHARESGDNTTPLHWAAASGNAESIRALLDAGADVHGFGDVHEIDVIGWATVYRPSEDIPNDVVSLLLQRGARHHIYSAIAVGEPDVIRGVVERNSTALQRRMSRFEKGMTPLHFAMERKRHDLLGLLIELGANLEAKDDLGQTALAVAMLRGDREAMRLLDEAGAKRPAPVDTSRFGAKVAKLAESTVRGVPGIAVPDIAAALDWYTSIGFTEIGRYEEDGVVNHGMVSFGKAWVMFGMMGEAGDHEVSLWFYTPEVERIYELLKERQLEASRAALSGEKSSGWIEFEEELYEPFYGGKQFSIKDPFGYGLIFYTG